VRKKEEKESERDTERERERDRERRRERERLWQETKLETGSNGCHATNDKDQQKLELIQRCQIIIH
jgi:hypothetical protein